MNHSCKPASAGRRSHYDANYSNFQTKLYEQIRRDAFGEDVGQNSWLTCGELTLQIEGQNRAFGIDHVEEVSK